MNSLMHKTPARAMAVECSDDELRVSLTDGRCLSVPIAWFPRLARATAAERADFELMGEGQGIHWPRVDEDISVEGLIAGPRLKQADVAAILRVAKATCSGSV